jgi:FkbM family methyltransferase
MILPVMMRRFGLTKDVDVETFWGGRFSGVLPEAVSTVIWRTSCFDEQVSMALLRFLKPGGVFLDIGAHFGFFSLLASHLVGPSGRVISVEAMPSTFQKLKANIEKNCEHKNFTLVPGAAFNREVDLEFSDFGLVASSLNSAVGNRGTGNFGAVAVGKIKVRAKRADQILADLGAPKVDFIKIDAESSEKFVLEGLSSTILRDKPVIVMEASDACEGNGASTEELISILSGYGYRAFTWNGKQELIPYTIDGVVGYENLVFTATP